MKDWQIALLVIGILMLLLIIGCIVGYRVVKNYYEELMDLRDLEDYEPKEKKGTKHENKKH